MAVKAAPSPPGTEVAKVHEQLERILQSKAFRQVERLQCFLRFIGDETLAGRGDALKEFLVGVEVFGKDSSFDPRTDPIVRVQARRLRARLSRYYQDEARGGEMVVELPKGGYTIAFHTGETVPETKLPPASASANRNTIAVSPFTDNTSEQDLKYFCRGLMDEAVCILTGTQKLRVLLAETPDGVPDAALRVSGSVRRSGDVLRITVNLTDGASGCYLWSASLDRKEADAFAVEEEVARAILEQVQNQMSGTGRRKFDRSTPNQTAYNLYLQGRHRLEQRTEEGLRKAVELFQRAAAVDPQFAQPYAGLSDAYALLGHYGVLSPAEVWTRAASNAAWAVLLDDDSAEAHTALAHAKSTQDWDFPSARREFQRAIALDSRYPTAHHWYAASCLAPLGRLEEALGEMLVAYDLDPVSSIISLDLAVQYYYRREFDAALEQCDRTLEQNPHFVGAYWTLGLIQEQRGDMEESAAAFRRAIQLAPLSPRMRGGLARILAIAGDRQEAVRILAELHKMSKKRYVSPFDLASIQFGLGNREEGYQWLTKAFQDRCFELVACKVDPRFDNVRHDREFKELSAQLGVL